MLGNKEILAKNLQYYLNQKGKSRQDLCDALNFNYSTVSAWLQAQKYPRIDAIEKMANYFNVQKSELIEEKKTEEFLQPIIKKKKVPILGVIAAGVPLYADQQIEGYIDTDRACIDYALRIKGDSMINAHILHGGLVMVDRDAKIENGDIAIVLIDGLEATVKRVYQYGDKIILRPENPTMNEIECNMKDVTLLGKVKQSIINF